ncbi:MAG: hypothetical protein GF421_07945 [Candidatus Aminicenantes bacterium]|nr:hypothetical protein [Candidatus Aminicenantes bacterium]
MKGLWENVIEFFSSQPPLYSGFYLSSHAIQGVHCSAKQKKVISTDTQPLSKGIIHPSLNEKNILKADALKEKFGKVLEKLNLTKKNTALIIPELTQKTFTFSFDSLPSSSKEREQIIRFRIKKKMPFLPDDARISYDSISNKEKIRVVAILTRTYIIRQYEEFFHQFGLNVRIVVPPSVGLMNVLSFESDEKFFLINIEKDSFSLNLFKNTELTVYRQKRFDIQGERSGLEQGKTEVVFQEVNNTLNYMDEMKSDKRIKIWLRSSENSDKIFEYASQKQDFLLQRIGSFLDVGLDLPEAEQLSPILGVLL